MHYIKGSQLTIPDALSRAPLSDTTPEIPESELSCYIHSVMSSLPISAAKHSQIAAETLKEATLQQLIHYLNHGWPESRQDAQPATRPYFNHRDQITTHEGLLLNGLRIIIPTSMRAEMRKSLHTGHIGIEKTKARDRETMFWPNINGEQEDMIKCCSTCQEHQNRQSSEPPIPHDIPDAPWQKVATDLFSLRNKDYVIVADYTSKFFDLSQLEDTEAPTVVMHTKQTAATNKPQHCTLKPLETGDCVRFHGKNAWDRKGVIVEKCPQPRSYKVSTDKGTTVRRNRKHLLHTKESLEPIEHIIELSDSETDDPQQLQPPAAAPEAPPTDQGVQPEQQNLNQQRPRDGRDSTIGLR
eukprot:Seg874.5 transcript_id=Seg874.5/GoldUCD/mRNA.D3Y31 product="putative protein K02A2.6" protein_id=Seg874.5/GoldUCD/D3Y31